MLRAFRFIVGLFSQKHGIVAFAFFLLLGILMRQAPEATQKNVISAALASVFYPAQMVISSVDEFRSVAHENEMLKEENARLRQETYYASEALQELARLHALVRFDDNDRIVVIEGPLKGLEGSIIKVDKRKQRAKICVDFGGTAHTMDLSFEDISKQ
jgi:transcription antitermination factor NusG